MDGVRRLVQSPAFIRRPLQIYANLTWGMYSPPAAQVPRAAGRGIAGQGTRDQVTRARADGDLHANGDETGSKT